MAMTARAVRQTHVIVGMDVALAVSERWEGEGEGVESSGRRRGAAATAAERSAVRSRPVASSVAAGFGVLLDCGAEDVCGGQEVLHWRGL